MSQHSDEWWWKNILVGLDRGFTGIPRPNETRASLKGCHCPKSMCMAQIWVANFLFWFYTMHGCTHFWPIVRKYFKTCLENGLLWSFNITFFGLKWKLRTLSKCYITKILPKSQPISQDKVKCPKILDFTKWKFAIFCPKCDGWHKPNVNKPNGHTPSLEMRLMKQIGVMS